MNRLALIVDDMPCIRRLVSFALSRAGFQVVEASNGQEGLDELDRQSIQLVIVDLNMPVMDGLDFLRAMRERPSMKTTPAVLLTTDIDASLQERARAVGANGCIQKPFDHRVIASVVQRLLP